MRWRRMCIIIGRKLYIKGRYKMGNNIEVILKYSDGYERNYFITKEKL